MCADVLHISPLACAPRPYARRPGLEIGCELLKPPSTAILWPLTYDAASEHKNATISATSSGEPARPIGFSCSDTTYERRRGHRSD